MVSVLLKNNGSTWKLITLKLLVFVCNIHAFRLRTNNCDIRDVFYKTKPLSLIEEKKKPQKIRELSNFNEIFRVGLSMNEFYDTAAIFHKTFLIFLKVT